MKLISRLTDILGIGLGIVIFTLMPYEVFGIAGVVWFYFWGTVGLVFFRSKPGKRLIDWSISHD